MLKVPDKVIQMSFTLLSPAFLSSPKAKYRKQNSSLKREVTNLTTSLPQANKA
jgi:hypothetical protein